MKTMLYTSFLLAASGACAEVITVDDNGKADFASIQAAIEYASDGDEILVAPGTYTGEGDSVLDTLGKAIHIKGSLDSQGNHETIVDGQGARRVVQCNSSETVETVFENLLITGGTATYGGGLYNFASSPTLENCTFKNNFAEERGAGLYNYFSSPNLANCIFTKNSATEGGGIHNFQSNPALNLCTFTANSAFAGGGMYNYDTSSPVLDNCTFIGNSASYGGGMYNDENSNPSLTGNVFWKNSADSIGGGMINFRNSSPLLEECSFTLNWANIGGGMHNDESNPVLTDTTVCGNEPDQIDGDWIDNGGNIVSDGCITDCFTDFNGDGVVDGYELTYVLGTWGTSDPIADMNGDGTVNGVDLTIILAGWGDCP